MLQGRSVAGCTLGLQVAIEEASVTVGNVFSGKIGRAEAMLIACCSACRQLHYDCCCCSASARHCSITAGWLCAQCAVNGSRVTKLTGNHQFGSSVLP